MANDLDHNNNPQIGRQISRDALSLPPEQRQNLVNMTTPNGRIFSVWLTFHVALWVAGFIGIIYFRGRLLPLLVISFWLGNMLHIFTGMQHDCGHRSAYKSLNANLWVGRFLAWFILMPFTTFTELHGFHHGFLGQKGKDPDGWFYSAGRIQAFLRECLFVPRFTYLSLTKILSPETRQVIIYELCFNLGTYALLVVGFVQIGAIDIFVFGFLLPLLFLAVFISPIFRTYEHYPMADIPLGDPRREDLRFNTVTISNRLVGLLTANLNYHLEHHVYPRVPFYRLAKLHKLFSEKKYLVAPYPLYKLNTFDQANL
ncbi:MAG: fatty acid desaturase [Methylotenera sp.]